MRYFSATVFTKATCFRTVAIVTTLSPLRPSVKRQFPDAKREQLPSEKC